MSCIILKLQFMDRTSSAHAPQMARGPHFEHPCFNISSKTNSRASRLVRNDVSKFPFPNTPRLPVNFSILVCEMKCQTSRKFPQTRRERRTPSCWTRARKFHWRPNAPSNSNLIKTFTVIPRKPVNFNGRAFTVSVRAGGKPPAHRAEAGACWRLRVTTASTSQGVSQPVWQRIKQLHTLKYQILGSGFRR